MRSFYAILYLTVVLIANDYCYSFKPKTDITKEEVTLYKKFLAPNSFLPPKVVKDNILKNRLFAQEFLKRYKLSPEERMALNLIIEKFLAQLYIKRLKREHPADERVLKSFYLDHKESFKPLEKVDISTIAVDSLKKADKIFFQLQKNPSSFEKIAKKESLDPSASDGGKYKGVSISSFHPLIRKWIKEHKVGDISQPIKIGRLYYIERLDNRYRVDTSYKNLHNDIKKIVEGAYMNQEIKKEFKRLKESIRE